jgi:peptidoglycan/xylan/chitin deacetylase (PgdA/CDA1 family)
MLVSLTFDDGNRVQYTSYFPILKEYGTKATFYVVTQWIGQLGRFNWNDLEELYDHGNEIGSHTLTHPHLTELSEKDLEFELAGSLAVLRRFKCTTLAYPFGEYDQEVIKCAKKYYSAARGYFVTGFDCNPASGGDQPYVLKGLPTEDRFPFRQPACSLLNLSLPDFKKTVTSFFSNEEEQHHNKWIILVFHGQAATHQVLRHTFRKQIQLKYVLGPYHAGRLLAYGYYVRMDILKFRWMCEYLSNAKNIEVVSVQDGAAHLRRQRQD